MKSSGVVGGDAEAAPNQTHLTARHIAFLDLDRLYFELERFKAERGWYNLNLTREAIEPLLLDQSWYQLLIPAEELAFDSFEKVRMWQEIALSLLKKYTERYYTFRKREWELPHLEYQELSEDDPNFLGAKDEPGEGYYRILIEKSQEEIVAKLEELKALIEKRRSQAVGISRSEGDLVWPASLRAAALSGQEDRRDQPGAAQQRRTAIR